MLSMENNNSEEMYLKISKDINMNILENKFNIENLRIPPSIIEFLTEDFISEEEKSKRYQDIVIIYLGELSMIFFQKQEIEIQYKTITYFTFMLKSDIRSNTNNFISSMKDWVLQSLSYS